MLCSQIRSRWKFLFPLDTQSSIFTIIRTDSSISSTSETSNITITRPRKITQNRQKNYPLRFGIARRFELLQRITEERLLCLLRQRNIWENYSGIYTPYIFTVMKKKGRRAVSNVCSGREREMVSSPQLSLPARCWEFIIPRPRREGRPLCNPRPL